MVTTLALAARPTIFVGFDSAWADNPKIPGGICAARFDGARFTSFEPPRLVGFDAARAFVEAQGNDLACLIAIDQPTIVRNATGMRPVERFAARFVSWSGGGVQPANTGKATMFGDNAPITQFLRSFDHIEDPAVSRTATTGRHIIEVFPALALPALDETFYGRLRGARYNPARKTFTADAFHAVRHVIERHYDSIGLAQAALWSSSSLKIEKPRKSDQDRLDALICLLIAIQWRLLPAERCVMLGDLTSGYIVTPVSKAMRAKLDELRLGTTVPMQ